MRGASIAKKAHAVIASINITKLNRSQASLRARAAGFASVLEQWLARFALEAQREMLGSYGKARNKRSAELRDLIRRFGVRTALDAAENAGKWKIPPEVRADALDGRFHNLPGLSDLEGSATRRADEIVQETYDDINRTIRGALVAAQSEHPAPASNEIARRIRGELGVNRMTYERASTIARTELTIAQNTGAAEGYRVAGIRKVRWSAYDDGRSGDRHHEQMNDHEPVELGGYFTLPSGVKMRHPGDPRAPVGEIVNCRCGLIPVKTEKTGDDEESTQNSETLSIPGIGEASFVQQARHVADGQELAVLSADAIDELWSKDTDYIERGGGKAEIGGRREGFQRFLESNTGPIETSSINFDEDRGKITFSDGRHRFSVLRDSGMKKIPVSIAPDELEALRRFLRARRR